VLKTDTIVDTIHLVGDEPPDLVARKALRVNLSDLASKGAQPLGYLLALSLTTGTQDHWVELFAKGLAQDQKEFGLHLLGGDTTHTPGPTTISVTIFGTTARRTIPRRGDAEGGDEIWLTGTLGDGALGLIAARDGLTHLQPAQRDFLVDRYHLPQPRLAAGQALAGLVHAAMDVSDGLVGDLAHIATHSGLDALVDWDELPLSPAGRLALAADPKLADTVLTGGDDYELLVTAPASAARRIHKIAHDTGTPITCIGRMGKRKTRAPKVRVVDAEGRDRTPSGPGAYRHA
jgi:thiamine-monophosphate kinase